MRSYEVMFILRPDYTETERQETFTVLKNTLEKFGTKITSSKIWNEKKKLFFPLAIKGKGVKFNEGLYYLVEFESNPLEIQKINAAYRINENILRFMIIAKEQ